MINNNIMGKNPYKNMINSYVKTPSSSNIKGTLLAINESQNKLRIGIGKDKALDITLNSPIKGKVGSNLIIEKQNIAKSEIVDLISNEVEFIENSINKYDYILESFEIPKNEDSIEAVKTLDNHGVDITKENIRSFMSAKKQLTNISEELDYDTVVKLKDKDVDFENESLQKVLQEMKSVQGEKRPFSLLRFLGLKKDMSTEDAEKISEKIYGNRMGKDITDIIKALDKAGIEATKEKIEEINSLFSKLNNIEKIEDKTLIDAVKNKMQATIDNLYKLKNAVVKGELKVEGRLGRLSSRAYGAYDATSAVTQGDLSKIEGNIRERLSDLGIKATEELVKLSKEVISKGLDLTKENLDKIMSIKNAIGQLNSDLNYEKTAALMASGIQVDKTDLVDISNMISMVESSVEENISIGLNRLEVLELIENLDLKTIGFHMKLNLPTTLKSLSTSQRLIDGDIDTDNWLNSLKNIEGFEKILSEFNESELKSILESVVKNENKELDLNAKTFLRFNEEKLASNISHNDKSELAKALLKNEISLNNKNMNEIYILRRNVDRVLDNLTSEVFKTAMENGNNIEKMNLNKLADLTASLNERNSQNAKGNEEVLRNSENAGQVIDRMKSMVDALKQIDPQRRDSIISILMKNAMPLTLKEVQNLSFFLSNKNQIGQEMDEILNLIDKNKNEEVSKLAEELKNSLMKINNHIKEGKEVGKRPYEEFSKILKELENSSTLLSDSEKSSLQKSGGKLLDSLELQLQLNREDTLLQLPIMVGEQFKNLQMYLMRDNKRSKKIDPNDMSVLLNFDTNNMGNLNVYVSVNYKNIIMKIGLEDKEDKNLIENYSKELENYFQDLGYELKDLSFRIDEDNNVMSMVEETEGDHRTLNKLLDVKI